jgi:preprotein translocase subunit SecE
MARLLRKKVAGSKKKVKQDSIDTPETSQETGNGLKKFVSDADASAETKKIQILPQKKTLTGTKTLQDKEKNSYLDRVLQFLREVKIELKKVTWPSRKQAVGSTVVVIILVIIISLFLGVVDIGLSSLVRVVLQ